jgi:hypothetical protein
MTGAVLLVVAAASGIPVALPAVAAGETRRGSDGCLGTGPPPDSAPPQVLDVTLGAAAIDVTAGPVDVPVHVRITDPGGSGVKWVRVTVGDPAPALSKSTTREGASADLRRETDDWWAGSITVGQWTGYVGRWQLERVESADMAGNWTSWSPPEPSSVPSFTIAPHPYDGVQPYLSDLRLDHRVVDVREHSDGVLVSARVGDEGGSGVQSVQVGSALLRRVSGTPIEGLWRGTLPVRRWSRSGYQPLVGIFTDAAGNVTRTRTTRLRDRDLPWRYLVRSTPDVTAPAYRTVRLADSAADVASSAVAIGVTARATDTQSGVYRGRAVLRGVDGSWRWSAGLVLRNGTRRDGVWRGSLELPCGFPAGRYLLELRLGDRMGNGRVVKTGLTLKVR